MAWLIGAIVCVLALFLCYRGAIVRARRSMSSSAIADAVHNSDAAEVARLLQAGADPNEQAPYAYRFLPGGEIEARIAIPLFGDAREPGGITLAALAAMQGAVEILDLLLEAGADANAVDKYGQTALIAAAWRGSLPCVRLLCDRGADSSQTDFDGLDALAWARIESQEEIAAFLNFGCKGE